MACKAVLSYTRFWLTRPYICEVANIGFYYTTNYFKHWRDNNEGSMFSSLRSLPAASEWLLCLWLPSTRPGTSKSFDNFEYNIHLLLFFARRLFLAPWGSNFLISLTYLRMIWINTSWWWWVGKWCGVLGRQMGPDSLLISDRLISRMMIDECCCTEGKTGTTALV